VIRIAISTNRSQRSSSFYTSSHNILYFIKVSLIQASTRQNDPSKPFTRASRCYYTCNALSSMFSHFTANWAECTGDLHVDRKQVLCKYAVSICALNTLFYSNLRMHRTLNCPDTGIFWIILKAPSAALLSQIIRTLQERLLAVIADFNLRLAKICNNASFWKRSDIKSVNS